VSYPQAATADLPGGASVLSVVDERIANYTAAERAATEAGENARARRFKRGLGTLTDLRRKVLNGGAVNDEDIPPPVVVRKAEAPPQPPNELPTEPSQSPPPLQPTEIASPTQQPTAIIEPISSPIEIEPITNPPASTPSTESTDLARVRQRREECKVIALKARDAGDKAKALAGLVAVKECDVLVKQLTSGEITFVTALPEMKEPASASPSSATPPPTAARQFSRDDPIQMPDNPQEIPAADPSTFGAPPAPNTTMEALDQRLAKYKGDEGKAKEQGNSSKARRLGRICKQYEEAIKLHKAGRQFPIEDLPTPPGFAPIPTGGSGPAVSALNVQPAVSSPAAIVAKPAAPSPSAASPAGATAAGTAKGHKSLRDKQLSLLLAQQAQFKEAAVQAKRAGQLDQAKEYLRQYKGYDNIIEACKSGLPVDFKTLPVPPQRKSGKTLFVIDVRIICDNFLAAFPRKTL